MSRLVAIEIENFMSIEKARMEFDETNILSPVGYNDSGKSAITRVIEIMCYNAYPNEQIKFIKDGAERWGVGFEFDDGVEINRFKYLNGNSLFEMFRDGKLIFTNRKGDNSIVSLQDIPEVIANYLGVIEDEVTNEQLNVRRNTDRLFLINTTGGDNYKILNSVLRTDILSEASSRINADRNSLQADVLSLKSSSETLKKELEAINVADDAVLDQLELQGKNTALTRQRAEYLTAIVTQKQVLADFSTYPEISSLDANRLSEITALLACKEQVDMPVFDAVPLLDVVKLSMLTQIQDLREAINVNVTPELPTVSVLRYNDIKQIGSLYNSLWQATSDVANTENELASVQAQLANLAQQYNFKICNNCGTVVQ